MAQDARQWIEVFYEGGQTDSQTIWRKLGAEKRKALALEQDVFNAQQTIAALAEERSKKKQRVVPDYPPLPP